MIRKIVYLVMMITMFVFTISEDGDEKKEKIRRVRKAYMDHMEIENKISVGIMGEYEFAGETNSSEANLSISSETLYKVENDIKFGLGASAIFRGRMKTDSGEVFVYDSLPIYFTYRFFPLETKKYKPFIKVNYGISFNHSDDFSQGIYYSGGFGFEVLDTWVYDLIYEKSKGEYQNEECSQTMLTLGIGYKIRF